SSCLATCPRVSAMDLRVRRPNTPNGSTAPMSSSRRTRVCRLSEVLPTFPPSMTLCKNPSASLATALSRLASPAPGFPDAPPPSPPPSPVYSRGRYTALISATWSRTRRATPLSVAPMPSSPAIACTSRRRSFRDSCTTASGTATCAQARSARPLPDRAECSRRSSN
ncbi:unnamed protein product, partial [Ectocarpus sp. 13 AM-2016]